MAREYYGDLFGCIIANGEQIPVNEKGVKITLTKPRNLKYHKHVFNVLGYTLKHMPPREGINTTERLLTAFKDYKGMYESIPKKDGSEIRIYNSISFANMDQVQFEEVAEQIHEFCLLVLHRSSQEVRESLINLMLF